MSLQTLLVAPADARQIEVEFAQLVDQLTRRGFLAGTLSATAVGLAACASHQPDPGSAASSPTGWSFTDDRGKVVDLPTPPSRIAFLTDTVGAALWAAGLHPVAATDSGQGIATAVGLHTGDGITQLYSADKGVDVEKLTAAAPDLMIDAVQPDGTLQVASELPQLAELAPIIGLSTYLPVEQIAATADRLTTSLGTELSDTNAQVAYQTASDRLARAITTNADLRVGFVFSIDETTIGVMNPKTWAVLKTVQSLGLKLVPVPDTADNTYSQAVSLERAADLPADLLIWAVSDPMPTSKVWAQVPAVRSGQIWQPDLASWYAYSWDNFSALLDGLAQHVTAAKSGIGSA